ncbi:hypothetical protein TNCV_2079101 [Trichonephila clavipes]|nr:hypothetical protein TNCV_2079101 [Trichonephila clavipes]
MMIPAYNKKGCAAFFSRRESIAAVIRGTASYCASLPIGRLGRARRGLDKLDLTILSGYEFRSTSAKGPVDLLRPGR